MPAELARDWALLRRLAVAPEIAQLTLSSGHALGTVAKLSHNMLGYMYSKPRLSRFLDGLKHPLIGMHPGALAK